MTVQDKATFERSCLVYGLKPEYVEAIYPLGTLATYRGGEEIIRHKATDADLYVILDGHVNVLTDDGDKLFEVGPGSVVGEIAFMDAGPRDASVVAKNYVSVLRFPAQELRRKMCSEKELGFSILANLSRLVCARLRNAEDRLDQLMDKAHEVWNLADN